LSESQSQCDELEKQLLRVSDYQNGRPLTASTATGADSQSSETSDSPVVDYPQQRRRPSVGPTANGGSDRERRLEKELSQRVKELSELSAKYSRRKQRHREMVSRLRQYVSKENRELNTLLHSLDVKYRASEEELQKHRKYCRIQEITAINDIQ
ncbi:unnamed protein product, partial [Medioppia subpectinata]